jgi:hypothetical protein
MAQDTVVNKVSTGTSFGTRTALGSRHPYPFPLVISLQGISHPSWAKYGQIICGPWIEQNEAYYVTCGE